MDSQHLSSRDLRIFADGVLPRERARTVVAHLLHGCGTCRAEAAPFWSPDPVEPDAYDAAFERVATTVASSQGPEQVDALLQRAWSLRHDDAAEMLRVVRRAVLAASGLSSAAWGAPRVADAQGRAWAGFGNACRIAGDLQQAQGALDRAAGFLDQGTGDPLSRAQLFDFQASLESARGHYDLALAALDAVQALHRERGDRHLEGRALISKGLQTAYAGRPREAFRLTQEGLALLDEARDPELAVSALHNQLWFLVESGHSSEARELLTAHGERLATGGAQRLDLLWLEGRIKAGLRDLDGALLDLEAAGQAFAAAGRRSQAANVKLDLAALQIRLGEPVRALALVRDAEEAFARLGAARTTRMALAFLRRALSQREVPAQFVLRLADLVRRNQTATVRG
jgi:tetratricopeptide (TPR) repeat protein